MGLIRSSLPEKIGKEYIDFVIVKRIVPGGTGFANNALKYNQFIDWHKKIRYVKSSDLNPEPIFVVLEKDTGIDTISVISSWGEYINKLESNLPE